MREQLKSLLSKTTDEAFDLVINLSGKYIDEETRAKLKKNSELEFSQKIEETITKAYETGLKLSKEYQEKKLEKDSIKDNFYLVTDTLFKAIFPDIPKHVHAMDHFFQVCEELMRDFRFEMYYLKETEYEAYLQSLERLIYRLKQERKIENSWKVFNDFKDSKDFFPILQATLQRILKCYEFLERDFATIEKKQIDRYLEIYTELSGLYEKFISLIAVLTQLLQMKGIPKYEVARKRGLSSNINSVKGSGWGIFVSGFNRKMRNAIAHKSFKIDIIMETVEFIDRNKTYSLSFKEVQEETRELSAVLLLFPNLFISIFCLAVLSIKEVLVNLGD